MVTNTRSPFLISDSDEDNIESSKYTEPLNFQNFENPLNERSSIKLNNSSNNNIISTAIMPVTVKNITNHNEVSNHLYSALDQEVIGKISEKYTGLLVLKNLSPCVNFEHLWEIFEPFGELESAAVYSMNNKIGVIKFKNADDALKALDILQGVVFFNQPLNIRTGSGDSRPHEKHRTKSRKEKLSKTRYDEIISSRFLLATNVFEKSMLQEDATLVRRLYADLLNIITYSKSNIYHMFVDEQSDYGAIFMATSTLEEAKLIFKALNGCLYESRKVVVDCIPSHLYTHLFPEVAVVSTSLNSGFK